ncbi:hypothetical protein QBK99_25690 [Corticibacterium sp. UT-5YL-CI-8]|nr:hypothetical protein [Tianweitania sp. UT-5YL-CI-8]
MTAPSDEHMREARDMLDVLDAFGNQYVEQREGAETILARYHELKQRLGFSEASAVAKTEFVARALQSTAEKARAEERQARVDLENAILACERSSHYEGVVADYRSVRRTIQDQRAAIMAEKETL